MITETDKAYLAGFIDGEGCISINKQWTDRTPTPIYWLIITVTSVDKDTLEYCRRMTGLGSIQYNRKSTQDNDRHVYAWHLTSNRAIDLLRMIYPYMKIKREQADIAFAFQETMGKSPVGGRGLGLKVLPEILHQRERYKQALTALKGYKSVRGRPPSNKSLELTRTAASRIEGMPSEVTQPVLLVG
jgi:hypothetical protein